MTELRRSYDLLIMKVISLVQHDDHMLASAIVSSRQTILGLALGPEQIRQPLKENP